MLDDEANTVAFYAALPPLWASVHLVGGFAMAKIADTTPAEHGTPWRPHTPDGLPAARRAGQANRGTCAG